MSDFISLPHSLCSSLPRVLYCCTVTRHVCHALPSQARQCVRRFSLASGVCSRALDAREEGRRGRRRRRRRHVCIAFVAVILSRTCTCSARDERGKSVLSDASCVLCAVCGGRQICRRNLFIPVIRAVVQNTLPVLPAASAAAAAVVYCFASLACATSHGKGWEGGMDGRGKERRVGEEERGWIRDEGDRMYTSARPSLSLFSATHTAHTHITALHGGCLVQCRYTRGEAQVGKERGEVAACFSLPCSRAACVAAVVANE